jgi:hypothetical protein
VAATALCHQQPPNKTCSWQMPQHRQGMVVARLVHSTSIWVAPAGCRLAPPHLPEAGVAAAAAPVASLIPTGVDSQQGGRARPEEQQHSSNPDVIKSLLTGRFIGALFNARTGFCCWQDAGVPWVARSYTHASCHGARGHTVHVVCQLTGPPPLTPASRQRPTRVPTSP